MCSMLNHATDLFGKADSTQSYVRSPSCYLYSLGAVSVEHTWTVPLWFSPLVRFLPWPESWNRKGMAWQLPFRVSGNSWRLLPGVATLDGYCQATLDGYWQVWQFFRLLARCGNPWRLLTWQSLTVIDMGGNTFGYLPRGPFGPPGLSQVQALGKLYKLERPFL